MKTPQWLTEEVARQGTGILDGSAPRATALAALTAAIGGHPECVADLIAVYAEKELSKWLGDNSASVPSPQLPLFPELPHRMRVAPSKYADTVSMDLAQLEHAKNMLMARTQNAIDGATTAAEHEREVFMAFYGEVRPLVASGLTVGDALNILAEGRAA